MLHFTSRLLHVLVGIAACSHLPCYGRNRGRASKIVIRDSIYDGNLTGSLNRTAEENYNIELPAAARSARRCIRVWYFQNHLLFYMINYSCRQVCLRTLSDASRLDTLRQISTIGLL